MKEKVFASLVVNISDDVRHIGDFLLRADEFLASKFEIYEIIAVDSACSKESLAEVESVAGKLQGALAIVSLTRRCTIEITMLAGTDKSIGDYVFEVESPRIDFPFSVLDQLYAATREGWDIVAAVPATPAPLFVRLFYALFNRLSDLDSILTTERVRILSRRALNSIIGIKDKTRYRKALLGMTGYPKKIISYQPLGPYSDPRTLAEKISLAIQLMTSFTSVGSKISIFLSLFFFCTSALAGVFAIYSYFYAGALARGWTSMTCFLSLSFSGLFMVLAILSEYVRQILNEVQNRPLYLIKAQRQTFPR